MINTSATKKIFSKSFDAREILTAPSEKRTSAPVKDFVITTSGATQPESYTPKRPRVEKIVLK